MKPGDTATGWGTKWHSFCCSP